MHLAFRITRPTGVVNVDQPSFTELCAGVEALPLCIDKDASIVAFRTRSHALKVAYCSYTGKGDTFRIVTRISVVDMAFI